MAGIEPRPFSVEATTLPTVPQPLPATLFLQKY